MTANDYLILVSGLFLTVIGVIVLMEIKKNNTVTSTKSILAIVMVTIGILIAVLPIFDQLDVPESQPNESKLMGAEKFDVSKPRNSGSYEEASENYRKGVSYWNNDMAKYDSTDLAMQYLDRSIAIYETAEAYTARGQLKVQLGLMRKGLKDYNRAIELKDSYGNAYYNRATVFYIFGEVSLACEDWKKAQELGMPNTEMAIASYCN